MTNDRQTFTAPESAATMAKIIDFITANDAVETGPIIALVKLSSKRVCEYLRHAAYFDLIHRLPRAKRTGRRGTNAIRWRVGPAPIEITQVAVDDRKQTSVYSYPPNQVTDPYALPVGFFGTQQRGQE